MSNPLISATYIWDNAEGCEPTVANPIIPHQLVPVDPNDIPKAQQNQGTPLERLVEMAGRVCYDSYGRGRTSEGFHQHILEVGHLSVLEHGVFTVEIRVLRGETRDWALRCLNIPALHVAVSKLSFEEPRGNQDIIQITANLRHALEIQGVLGMVLRYHAHRIAPWIVPTPSVGHWIERDTALVAPVADEQVWATMLLTGSRGFSHELVRHGDWTGISQRSTRYVDESESPWVQHPLETAFLVEQSESTPNMLQAVDRLTYEGKASIAVAQDRYKATAGKLEPWLIARGVDKGSAKKQSRGAARGYLGNALYTEVVFSASIKQWKHMLRARACGAADAEIREVFCQAAEILFLRHPARFAGWTIGPSPDGIGRVVTPVPDLVG